MIPVTYLPSGRNDDQGSSRPETAPLHALQWGGFSDDKMCLAGASTTDPPGALFRGGDFGSYFGGGPSAGVFMVGVYSPSTGSAQPGFGFRCAR
jgi:hypothetical protein